MRSLHAYGSVVRGDAGHDEHEVEGDDELDDQRLHVGPRRHRAEEVLPRVPEQQPQRQARRRRPHDLRRRVSRHLHACTVHHHRPVRKDETARREKKKKTLL
jgi:hypothetical protein